MNNSLHLVLPGVIVAATAILVLFGDLLFGRRGWAVAWVAAAGLVVAAGVALGQWVTWQGGWKIWLLVTSDGFVVGGRKTELGFANMVALDRFGLFFFLLFCLIGVLTIMLSERYLARHDAQRGEYYALLLLVITGMTGMAIATDFVALFVSFELMSLPTYLMAGYLHRQRASGEAALKYFINGAFSSAVLLFGLALVYGVTGQTSYRGVSAALAKLDDANAFAVLGLVMIATGLGFKIAAVPFHGWAPDVYEGAPTPVTAFMSVGIKAAAFAGMVRLFATCLAPDWHVWWHILAVLAVLTMVVGNVLALPQRNLKRMLAYSSIAHAGYLLLGLIALGGSARAFGPSAVLFYLVGYAFMNLGAFGILVLIRDRRPFEYTLDEMAGLGRSMPLASFAMMLFMLSLTGIPPLVGFWGKFYLFSAVVSSGLTWLAVVAVVMSAVSAFYYLRVVWFMYFREPDGKAPALEPAATGTSATLALAVLGVVAIGLYPQPVIAVAQNVLAVLLRG